MKWTILLCCVSGVLSTLASNATGQELPAGYAESFAWRSLGPAVMSGRIVDVAVDPTHTSTLYVASASGGLFKTKNRGGKWTPIFDNQNSWSIGALAVCPTKPQVIWVGTGEANNQRSSYWGDGVYKSTDAGKTWKWCGLPQSHHIGRIACHPTDANTVFVAVLGHLYTPNVERGLYRTQDGGRSFEPVLQINANVGVVDVVIDPADPQQIYAATYERRRRPWNLKESGPGSGIWKSSDGGETWTLLKGGLPKEEIGRIGLTLYHGENRTVIYACVENRNLRLPDPPAADDPTDAGADLRPRAAGPEAPADDDEEGVDEPERRPGSGAPVKRVGGEVYRSEDGGESWDKRNQKPVAGRPAYYYGQIRVDPNDPERVWLLGVALFYSQDGGQTWKSNGARKTHVDHHALWIDPTDSQRMILGNDGGLAFSQDRGKNWDVLENLPLSQFYAVGVDNARPYRIYGGLQDNGSYMIPSQGERARGIMERETLRISGGDGFYCVSDPHDPNIVYTEGQFGRPKRTDLRTFQSKSIRPPQQRGACKQRFNWMTPIVLCPQNSRTVYIAGERLYRSTDRGDTWYAISPDLTSNDALKLQGNVPHCTITTVSVSAQRPAVIWVGTDDGKLQLTRDSGGHWTDLTPLLPAQVAGLWVSRVFASVHERGKCYVSFSGYRQDRFEPLLFVTDDYGGTWTNIGLGLPSYPVNVVREDKQRAGLLFVGLERGIFVSPDDGQTWHPLQGGMPLVPVHDLAIQEREAELVVGTHGRGLYVSDIQTLRELKPANMAKAAYLCPIKVVSPAIGGFSRGSAGAREFLVKNPPAGAFIRYHLKRKADEQTEIRIEDAAGRLVRRLSAPAAAGLNEVVWDLRRAPTARRRRGGARAGRPRRGAPVASGDYVVLLRVLDKTYRRVLHLDRPLRAPALAEGEDSADVHQIE